MVETLPIVRTFSAEDDDAAIYALPARAMPLERAQGGPTSDELMALAVARAGDEHFLRENPPYFWRAEISNSRVDAYFTVMQDSTLKNFARDAAAGVPFQNSHNVRTLPFGASLTGRFHNGRGDTPARVEADFYTIPGLRTNEVSTDDLIRGQRAGVLRDVSVGFTGGQTICSICNRDMNSFWDYLFGDAEREDVCLHFPGETYPVKDAAGKPTGEKALCLGQIENAGLVEVSQVYRGATPGAAIQKARAFADAGKLPPELARSLEQHYRIHLPQSHRAWAGHGPGTLTPTEKEPPMPDATPTTQDQERTTDATTPPAAAQPADQQARQPVPPTMLTPAVREELTRWGFTLPDDDGAALRQAGEEISRLRTLAQDGQAYRDDLIEQAITQGKRAQGVAFPEAGVRAMLAGATLEHVKQMRDSYRALADALVTPGARVDATVATDDGAQPAGGTRTRDLPDSAYRAR